MLTPEVHFKPPPTLCSVSQPEEERRLEPSDGMASDRRYAWSFAGSITARSAFGSLTSYGPCARACHPLVPCPVCTDNARGERRAKRVRSSAKLAVDTSLPTPRISLHVHTGDNSDTGGCRDEIRSVREPPEEAPATALVDLGEALGTSSDLLEADIDGSKEFCTQADRTRLVPQRRLCDVRFGGWPDYEAWCHSPRVRRP